MADEVGDGAPEASEQATVAPAPVPPTVGWAIDPFGRFGARYWDGTEWTEQVLDDDGRLAADPAPLTDPPRWLPQKREPEVVVAPPPRFGPDGSFATPPPPPPPASIYRPAKKRMSGWKIFGIVCAAVVVLVIGLIALVFFTALKPAMDEANGYFRDLKAGNLTAAQHHMCSVALSDPASDLAHLDAVGWRGQYDLTRVEKIRGTVNSTTVTGTVGDRTAVVVYLGDGDCILGVEILGAATSPQ